MFKRSLIQISVVVLALASTVLAVDMDVVLVTSDGSTNDYAIALQRNFLNVSLVTQGAFVDPVGDQTQADAINASDLVIISRYTSSGSYASNAAEVDFWNSLTQPLVLHNGYIVRGNSRWGWTNTTGTNTESVGGHETEVLLPADPIFNGITTLPGTPELADLFTGDIRMLADSADIGADGILLATGAGDHNALIARFAVNDVLVDPMAGTAVTAHGGDRIFFGMHENGQNTGGLEFLTDDGKKVWINALVELGLEQRLIDPDINGDGSVDLVDFDILRGNFLVTNDFAANPIFTDGDIDFNDIVDEDDFRIWKNAFLDGGGSPDMIPDLYDVPEPATLSLLVIGGIALVRRRR